MAYDPYTADSGYVRFHLVRMVAEKLPLWDKDTGEVIELLEALSAYIAGGTTPPEEEEETPEAAPTTTTMAMPGGGYI